MKTVYLVRHATAVDKGDKLPDFERSLTAGGEKEAKFMARHVPRRKGTPALMVSSFANRAIETAHIFAKAMGYPARKILLKDTFYGDVKPEILVDEIRHLPDKCSSVMLFGHDPAFSALAAHFVKGFKEIIPKCGVAGIEFPSSSWAALRAGQGRLVFFSSPAQLKEEKKRLRGDLEARLVDGLEKILGDVSRPAAAAVKKNLRRAVQKLVKEFLKNLPAGPPLAGS